jgi:CDP-glycerol glycerophosphotransferase (TagB/SpsB family)
MEQLSAERVLPKYDRTEVTYKKQGDDSDSWVVEYFLNDELVHKEMLYKDPSKPDTTEAEKFIDSITPDLSASLCDKMIESLTNEQIEALKNKLK